MSASPKSWRDYQEWLAKRPRSLHDRGVGSGRARGVLPARSLAVCEVTMLIQAEDRNQWLSARRQVIGASEIAAVMGLSPWKSPYSVWAEKCGIVPKDDEETDAQRWGLMLEPVIADEYVRQTGRALIDHGRYAVRSREDCPFIGCTLDREIVPIDDRGPGALEIKTTHAFNADDWSEGAPLLYQIQIQAQLFVTGWKWGSAAVLIGGQTFRWCDVERNEKFIAHMVEKCRAFWQLVETRTPPPVDGHSATAETLRALYPKDTGESVALPGEAIHWDAEIANADIVIKEAEAKKRDARNKLIAAIGSASVGVLPDGGKWSYRTIERAESVTKASSYRALRRIK